MSYIYICKEYKIETVGTGKILAGNIIGLQKMNFTKLTQEKIVFLVYSGVVYYI